MIFQGAVDECPWYVYTYNPVFSHWPGYVCQLFGLRPNKTEECEQCQSGKSDFTKQVSLPMMLTQKVVTAILSQIDYIYLKSMCSIRPVSGRCERGNLHRNTYMYTKIH